MFSQKWRKNGQKNYSEHFFKKILFPIRQTNLNRTKKPTFIEMCGKR